MAHGRGDANYHKRVVLKTCSTGFQPRSLLAYWKPFSRTKRRFLKKKKIYLSISLKKNWKKKYLPVLHSMWHLSSWTRDWTHATAVGVWSLNRWSTWEVPKRTIFNAYIHTPKLVGSEDCLTLIFLNTGTSSCHIISQMPSWTWPHASLIPRVCSLLQLLSDHVTVYSLLTF